MEQFFLFGSLFLQVLFVEFQESLVVSLHLGDSGLSVPLLASLHLLVDFQALGSLKLLLLDSSLKKLVLLFVNFLLLLDLSLGLSQL